LKQHRMTGTPEHNSWAAMPSAWLERRPHTYNRRTPAPEATRMNWLQRLDDFMNRATDFTGDMYTTWPPGLYWIVMAPVFLVALTVRLVVQIFVPRQKLPEDWR